jgi:hypothetical protein
MAGYGTDEGFATYIEANGLIVPTGGNVAAARQRGSMYVDGTYGRRFPGVPAAGAAQDRAWPRTGAVDRYGNAITGIPERIVSASYEAAAVELRTPGALSRTYTPAEQKVLVEVKGIKWQVTGDANAKGSSIPIVTAIEGLLAPLLCIENFPAILVV